MTKTVPSDLPRLPRRAVDAHKGTFGTVGVIGGSDDARGRMIGAPALCAEAAVRTGAGLAKLVMPETVLTAGLMLCPTATGIPIPVGPDGIEPHEASATVDRALAGCTVLAVGPGLGTSSGAQAAVLRAIQQDEHPLVLDADGINCLGLIPEFSRDFHAAAVLTPHPGEFKRLCGAMGLKDDLGLAASREGACTRMAQRLGRIVVLKGAATVVSDGLRSWACPAGHPCLATGGTGDVLTGVIAGVIAQFCPTVQQMLFKAKVPQMPWPVDRPLDLYSAACVGVFIHALAGERWAKEHGAEGGLLATDLPALLPGIVEGLRAGA